MPPLLFETNKGDQLTYLSKQDVEKRVQSGQMLIIYNKKVYKLNKWIKYHPGGDLAIIHMIGKDATDEINVLHPEYVTKKKIHNFYIGEYNEEQSISNSFKQLELKIKELGLYQCNYWNYFLEGIRYLVLIISAWLLVIYGTQTIHYILSAILLGFFWHQLAFTAHDSGHSGITHNLLIDNLIGIFLADFCGGLSIAWWKRNHYVHHIVTNHPEHDPDIQHLPFFAVSTKFLNNVYSTFYKRKLDFDIFAKFFISYQHYLYYPVLCFGRFNLYFLSISFLINQENVAFRNLEKSGMIFFWCWYFYMLSHIPSIPIIIIFIILSHAITMILHVQITLSHFGMSTEELGPIESFPRKMTRTTMDVDCPWWMDWFHGGLQYQTIHHLFPRVPRHNLRRCQPLVQNFCKEVGLKYHLYGFIKEI
ncbi:4475_t:CDS:2 [Diversispora eburnea]|uniref:4475_t:CDS:1 n=1 Tax=Diversispora eburnea TaxID=1213867 RepID=A0A9N9BJN7_9GLOM|nr:4475_t:CDS:2 [Diversispora eburnea]